MMRVAQIKVDSLHPSNVKDYLCVTTTKEFDSTQTLDYHRVRRCQAVTCLHATFAHDIELAAPTALPRRYLQEGLVQ